MAATLLSDLPAPAKLNLFLHVVGRRPDGYHLLQSVFVLIDWCDTLHLEHRADGRLQRHDLGAALPADDLCLRAARLLQQDSGCSAGADISIDKQLPWGAGLGGGSSNAATVLIGLNRLWGLHWPRERLLALAARLGADVPFFVGGDNAFVEGIGERLTPVALPRQWYAVVKPAEALETARIFGHPLLVRDSEAVIVEGSLEHAPGTVARRLPDALGKAWAAGFGRNDLQAAAEAECPAVAQAARWLADRFGNSRMTGSGSAVFSRAGMGSAPDIDLPTPALAPGWLGRMCRGLDRHPLADWADRTG